MIPRIAVVIPVYKAFENLDFTERISLTQTSKVLSTYYICFVTHPGVDVKNYQAFIPETLNVKTKYFNAEYFKDLDSYNRLLKSPFFYKAFSEYKYILLCQLDVFVFYDNTEHFIKLNYDYIGAPWFEGYNLASKSSKIVGVGNGGFSLRKISSFIRVLTLFELFKKDLASVRSIKEVIAQPLSFIRILKYELVKNKNYHVQILPWKNIFQEDYYWGYYIKQFFPWFRVGNVADAISFCFEVNPDVLYEMNNFKLPMATHAWPKYNISFWKPIIESYGYNLS